MQLIAAPSPNFDARGAGASIDMLVLHYTGMPNGESALQRMCDPAAKVSAHYMIEEDGRVFQLVAEEHRAWHAGVSYWQGARNINERSIGIELVNPGHEFGYQPFPETQMSVLIELANAIVGRHGIPRERVLGHSDVAPQRKEDPGELFDWQRLHDSGLGLWPSAGFKASANAPTLTPGMSGPAVIDLQTGLDVIGYWVEGTGLYDDLTEASVRAFQRHFRPTRVDGIADAETCSLIANLTGR